MKSIVAAVLSLFIATQAEAQLIVYPARGQSAQQQQRDQSECSAWAAQQTGFDPYSPPPPPPGYGAQSAPPVVPAMRGAAIGAIGGAIGGNAGLGAAIGAGAGLLFGGLRRAEYQQQQQQYYQQRANAYNDQRGEYFRAQSLCLTSRGYTVSN